MTEQWRPVAGYPMYEVSDLGRIRTYHRNRSAWDAPLPRVLTRKPQTAGYVVIMLLVPPGTAARRPRRAFMVHRLVAEAFIPKPARWAPDWEVHHRNGERSDNRAENLEWITVGENRRLRRAPRNPYQELRERIAQLEAENAELRERLRVDA